MCRRADAAPLTAIRTVDALWAALGTIADAITPAECANYLRNSGYFQSA